MNGMTIVATRAIVRANARMFVLDAQSLLLTLRFSGMEALEFYRTRGLTILLQCLERGL
jgi:hypothetical protein